MYYVYLIQNKKTKEIYIGYFSDLKRRLIEHNEHKEKNPELLYYEAYRDKRDAVTRELRLEQRGQSVRWLKERAKFSFL